MGMRQQRARVRKSKAPASHRKDGAQQPRGIFCGPGQSLSRCCPAACLPSAHDSAWKTRHLEPGRSDHRAVVPLYESLWHLRATPAESDRNVQKRRHSGRKTCGSTLGSVPPSDGCGAKTSGSTEAPSPGFLWWVATPGHRRNTMEFSHHSTKFDPGQGSHETGWSRRFRQADLGGFGGTGAAQPGGGTVGPAGPVGVILGHEPVGSFAQAVLIAD